MEIYKENIKRIKEFMESKLAIELNEQMFKDVIEALMKDVDICDSNLLKKAKMYSENNDNICFAPDGICGWKILYDVYGKESWIDKYEIIRGSELGELYWPCEKKDKKQTINIERSLRFGDRIDLTLYDIKNYLEGMEYVMTYANSETRRFLEKYKKKNGFNEFINEFGLSEFILRDEDEGVIQVRDLSASITKSVWLSGKIQFVWSNRFGAKKKKEMMQDYLDNLVSICESNQKNKRN